jgi:hypothetical protein
MKRAYALLGRPAGAAGHLDEAFCRSTVADRMDTRPLGDLAGAPVARHPAAAASGCRSGTWSSPPASGSSSGSANLATRMPPPPVGSLGKPGWLHRLAGVAQRGGASGSRRPRRRRAA